MADYIVSARKYRPLHFTEMVGQDQVATTLKNAIRTHQVAHSFLFCGPRGVGKTTAARILAKTINCENITTDFEACDTCGSCKAFAQNSSFNIHELDAASNNSVDDIRALVEQVRFPPQTGKYKIYIIDEVHMLSPAAFNAFLKTLEEPPAYCKFILATTEKHKILPTILSRCQIFDFKRIGIDIIVNHLQQICQAESISAEVEALHIIAQKADGGMRDALSMLDRLSSFSGGTLTYASVLDNLNVLDYDYYFKLTDFLLQENVSGSMQLLDQILKKGFEGDDLILGLCEHFRNLLFCKDIETIRLMETSENLKQKYAQQATLASNDFLVNCLQLGNQCDLQYKASKNRRLTVELALIKMCYINALVNAEASPESGKKKLYNVNTVADKTAKVEESNPTKAEIETRKELPTNPVNAPAKRSTPPIQLTRTKKVLTANEINSGTSEPEKQTNEEEEEVYNGPIRALSLENILQIWEEYAATIHSDKIGLKINFTTYKPVLTNESKLVLTVQSEVQKNTFEQVQHHLQRFIAARVGQAIDFTIHCDKTIQTAAKPYTPKEKLEFMIQKNPAIKTMQQRFGLELDYN
jgi:DNA polymerase-3 subunit gamma/tau